MKNFKVSQSLEGEVVIIKAQGYLNDLGGEEIEKTFKDAVKQGKKKFILDFSKIAYINSIGVSFLVGIVDKAKRDHLKVCFTHLSKINAELFEMVGLKKYAPLFTNHQEAMKHLSRA
jgi:anti-anti-sigma factor